MPDRDEKFENPLPEYLLEQLDDEYEAALEQVAKGEGPIYPEAQQEMLALNHAMQSAVSYQVAADVPGAPLELQRHLKHLRVGINTAHVICGALQYLMIRKEIVTRGEITAALLTFTRREKAMNERMAKEKANLPDNVTFG